MAEARIIRGLARLRLGRRAGAEQDFAQGIALKPELKSQVESDLKQWRASLAAQR